MKTYEQFRREIMAKLDEGLLNSPVTFGEIEELAAKEYAKQWVKEANPDSYVEYYLKQIDAQ